MCLVVGQQGGGEAGVVAVVSDAVLGVQQALGVPRLDEGRRPAVEKAVGQRGGDLEALQAGREDERGPAQAALPQHRRLARQRRLQRRLVGNLQSLSARLESSCNEPVSYRRTIRSAAHIQCRTSKSRPVYAVTVTGVILMRENLREEFLLDESR